MASYAPHRPTGSQDHTSRQAWSVTDPAWWIICLAAIAVSRLAPRALPGDPDDLIHFAASFPLGLFIAITSYWRLRLRASWIRAFGLGLGAVAVVLCIGWLKGRL